jgi:tripartite-type tricarboxylate transporter receptor subunit TctC
MKLLSLLLSASVAVLSTSAAAQPYPSKAVTIIVPYAGVG